MYNWLRNTLAIDDTLSTVAHLEASYPHFAVCLSRSSAAVPASVVVMRTLSVHLPACK